MLDAHDNLPTSFKYVVDALSDLIVDSWDGPWKPPHLTAKRPKGQNDSDPRIEWKYDQQACSGKENKGIRIDIFLTEKIDSKT